MLKRLRSRLHGEGGFTLIELLVVILIIGILAAIAIPSFLNQKGKGEDAGSKSTARTAQTAMETHFTDGSTYVCGADQAACLTTLRGIEPSLPTSGLVISATGGAAASIPTATAYRVTFTGTSTRQFYVDKNGSTVVRGCVVPAGVDRGGCPSTNLW